MYKKHITTICCFFIISNLITTSIVIAKDNGNGKPDLCDKFEEKKDYILDNIKEKDLKKAIDRFNDINSNITVSKKNVCPICKNETNIRIKSLSFFF